MTESEKRRIEESTEKMFKEDINACSEGLTDVENEVKSFMKE